MTMENAVFNFVFADASFPVRTVTIDNEPWFVAKDVCDAIGVSNPTVSLQALDDNEVSDLSLTEVSSNGTEQARKHRIISEGGMYTLVLRCRQASPLAGTHKQPSNFLRGLKAKSLISRVESDTPHIRGVKSEEGRGGNTYCHVDILLAYAAWIDADFYVTVAKTFGNVARGDIDAAIEETVVASCSSIRFRK